MVLFADHEDNTEAFNEALIKLQTDLARDIESLSIKCDVAYERIYGSGHSPIHVRRCRL